MFDCFRVDPPGFEPGQTEPKSVVLPLHHGSVKKRCKYTKFFIDDARGNFFEDYNGDIQPVWFCKLLRER